LVRDTPKSTLSAEDVATRLIISRTRDVLPVDSLIRKSESITGLRRLDRERERAMVEWLMLKKLSEELRMDSDTILLLKPNQENKTETNNSSIYGSFIFYNFFYFHNKIYNG
jgi:hypothetical protein